ncbi:hypothetical protein ACFE04_027890 [Oxalis oulophora]
MALQGMKLRTPYAINNFPRDVWKKWQSYPLIDGGSLREVFSRLTAHSSKDIIAEFCSITWNIWNARNSQLWRNKKLLCSESYRQAVQMLGEWRGANDRSIMANVGIQTEQPNEFLKASMEVAAAQSPLYLPKTLNLGDHTSMEKS